jgi:hypothetical protein
LAASFSEVSVFIIQLQVTTNVIRIWRKCSVLMTHMTKEQADRYMREKEMEPLMISGSYETAGDYVVIEGDFPSRPLNWNV